MSDSSGTPIPASVNRVGQVFSPTFDDSRSVEFASINMVEAITHGDFSPPRGVEQYAQFTQQQHRQQQQQQQQYYYSTSPTSSYLPRSRSGSGGGSSSGAKATSTISGVQRPAPLPLNIPSNIFGGNGNFIGDVGPVLIPNTVPNSLSPQTIGLGSAFSASGPSNGNFPMNHINFSSPNSTHMPGYTTTTLAGSYPSMGSIDAGSPSYTGGGDGEEGFHYQSTPGVHVMGDREREHARVATDASTSWGEMYYNDPMSVVAPSSSHKDSK